MDDVKTVISGMFYKHYSGDKEWRQLGSSSLTSGVEDRDGNLVAWTLQHTSGFLGMTFVKPEHRNKGLGKYVTVVLARQIIDEDGFCLVAIEEDNAISVRMHEGLGFTRIGRSCNLGQFNKR